MSSVIRQTRRCCHRCSFRCRSEGTEQTCSRYLRPPAHFCARENEMAACFRAPERKREEKAAECNCDFIQLSNGIEFDYIEYLFRGVSLYFCIIIDPTCVEQNSF